MIASTTFYVIFLLVLIAKTSSTDLIDVKKSLPKPLSDLPAIENQNSVPKITVSIYYGSLCSECANLFTNQIGPNLVKFQKYVNFDFVPFGSTEKRLFEGRWHFRCRKGHIECVKNKWQACSIHTLPSKPKLLASYLICYMNSTNEMHSGYQCTKKLGLYEEYYGKIKKCFLNNGLSSLLMEHYGNQTQSVVPRLTRMPSVLFNGVYNEMEQDDAKKDLGNVICKHLHPKPVEIC